MARTPIGEALATAGLISDEQLKQALARQNQTGKRLGQVLTDMGLVTDRDVAEVLSRQLKVPFIDLKGFILDEKVVKLVTEDFARRYRVLPINRVGDRLTVAMVDPLNVVVQDDLQLRTGRSIRPVVVCEADLMRAIDEVYGDHAGLRKITDELAQKEDDEAVVDMQEVQDAQDHDAAPIIRLVNMIIARAVESGASDIHIEPYEKALRVRYRRDGMLSTEMEPPKRAQLAIMSRIKILGQLDIAEKRMPQDGRIKMRVKHKVIDLRLSTLPTAHGEKAVMRILDQSGLKVDLGELGFEPSTLARFREGIAQPYGIILVTGPTGSGKTTTLYSALAALNQGHVNIMTAEDPIEYQLHGINQVHCRQDIGLTFAHALKSFLRQDPDIIMVGEIRDYETAEIAIKASMTGHLVLSTLHTNDAPSTIGRLTDMGVEPFMITSSVLIIQAQRLVRKVCVECRREVRLTPTRLDELGITPPVVHRLELPQLDANNLKFFEGAGCERCEGNGYRGRIGVYEVLRMSETMRQCIMKGGSTTDMFRLARAEGMLTLRESALRKALEGVTSPAEVLRVTATDR